MAESEFPSVVIKHKQLLAFLFTLALTVVLGLSEVSLLHTSSVYDDLAGPKIASDFSHIGRARFVRGDEFAVETPIALSQARSGNSATSKLGIGGQTGVSSYAPSRWGEVFFRPFNIFFKLLGPNSALLARMWSVIFFSLWAFYAFARKVNPKLQWLSAVVLAVIGVLSPPMMWWFTISNWTAVAGPLIGLVCFLEGRRRWSALLWSLLGGYVVGSTLAVGYPAFSLVVGLCAGLILSGKILGSDFLGWRISAFFLGTFATGFVFYLSNSASVKLMIGTIYPGNRISSSGEDSVIRALGGPFSYYLDNDAAGVQPALSASLYIFTLGTLILLFGLARRRRSGQPSQSETLPKLSRSTWLGLTGALAAFVLISGWAFGFVPNVIGHLIGFGRVPGPRTVMGFVVIELALGAMAIEMSGSTSEMRPIPGFIGIGNVRSNRVFGLLSPAVAAVVVVMSVGMVLRGQVGANLLSGRNVVLYSVLTACCVAVFVGAQRQLVRLAPTLVLSIFLSAWVHPLSIGLGSADVLSLKAAQLARDQIGTKPITWIANDDVRLSALTLESGNRTLSGPYFVPDLALWKLLDPTNSAKSAWNRFAHVVFKLKGGDGETSNPVISAPQLDVVVVEMGVCNPKLAELGVTNVLSTSTIEASCIQHMNNVATTRLWVWGLSSKSQL